MPSLTEHAAAHPDKPAVVEVADGDRHRSYGELSKRVNQLARVYQRLGATPDSRVAVMLSNGLEFVEAGLATAVAQTCYVPVNCHLKPDELLSLPADIAAKVRVTTQRRKPFARAVT